MSDFWRIGEMSALGLHAVGMVVAKNRERLSANTIAAELQASPHTTRQVLNRLVKAGLLFSTRGPSGGFVLASSPAEITLWQVICAVEGREDIQTHGCLFRRPVCIGNAPCPFAPLTEIIDSSIRSYFQKTTIADLQASFNDPNNDSSKSCDQRCRSDAVENFDLKKTETILEASNVNESVN